MRTWTAKHLVAPLVAVAALCAAAFAAAADNFPTQPIRLVVPFPAGGPTDVPARQLGGLLAQQLGTTVFVENRAGAQGVIGTSYVKDARPDGYTLLFNELTATFAIQPSLAKIPPYSGKDFTPIGLVAYGPAFLIVRSDLPVRTLEDLLKLSLDAPGGLTYGASGGMGQMPSQIVPELIKLKFGVKARGIVYRGAVPALVDVSAGLVDFTVTSGLVAAQSFVQKGKVRLIAVTGKGRSNARPDVPTFQESGFPLPEMDRGSMWGVLGPAGMPPEVVQKLERAVVAAQTSAAFKEAMNSLTLFASEATGAAALRDVMASDIKAWPALVRRMGISAD